MSIKEIQKLNSVKYLKVMNKLVARDWLERFEQYGLYEICFRF